MSQQEFSLTSAMKQAIDKWVAKFPADQKQSAVIPALHIVQDEYRYLTTEVMNEVAEYLDMPPISVYEVATFYSMFELKPIGQNVFNICTNVSCLLRGSEAVVSHVESRLGIKMGESTEDGKFALKEVECLGACDMAPMMLFNKKFHEDLTPEKLDKIIDSIK